MESRNNEKPLFSEVFYRSEKKFIDEKVKEGVLTTALMLFGGGLVFVFLLSLYIYGLIKGTLSLWDSKFIYMSIAVFGTLGWIIWIIWLHFDVLNTSLSYIQIFSDRIQVIVGNKKIKTQIPKEKLLKIVVNIRKKRIEIYLKNGQVIYSKRYDKRWMQHNFLSYDQFERFKKAMKEIGAEYEIVYA